MPYEAPLSSTTVTVPGSRLRVIHGLHSRAARETSDGIAPSRTSYILPVEPMLLVYQEQRETFRLFAVAVRRCLWALMS